MADYVVELIGEHGYAEKHVEMALDFDPTCDSTDTRDLIRELVWSNGGCFHPIIGEEAYPGWYRFVINLSPPRELPEEETPEEFTAASLADLNRMMEKV
jgi:hypothetical protein